MKGFNPHYAEPGYTLFKKQCRYRSAGLIRIMTVFRSPVNQGSHRLEKFLNLEGLSN